MLHAAGASLSDIVSIRQWLTDADDISAYVAVRSEFVKHEPASFLGVIPALVWPNLKVEVEVIAAVYGTGALNGALMTLSSGKLKSHQMVRG